jgi:ATP-dependent protease ClpP protease subunit
MEEYELAKELWEATAELQTYNELYLLVKVTDESAARLGAALMKKALDNRLLAEKPYFILNLFCYGGSASAGFYLYGVLWRIRQMGFQIVTRIQGGAFSMAGILAQAGTTREMDAAAIFHIHTLQCIQWERKPDVIAYGDEAERVSKLKTTIARIFSTRNTAGYTDDSYWIATFLQGREHYFTAEEALQAGLIDVIVGNTQLV